MGLPFIGLDIYRGISTRCSTVLTRTVRKISSNELGPSPLWVHEFIRTLAAQGNAHR